LKSCFVASTRRELDRVGAHYEMKQQKNLWSCRCDEDFGSLSPHGAMVNNIRSKEIAIREAIAPRSSSSRIRTGTDTLAKFDPNRAELHKLFKNHRII
jgi:hypothetical protein